MRAAILTAPLLVILLHASASALPGGWEQPTDTNPVLPLRADGTIRHAPSGYLFPARLGAMPMRKKVALKRDDVAVEYSDLGGGNGDPWLDIIVFDGPSRLDAEAESIDADIPPRIRGAMLADDVVRTPADARGARSHWWRGALGDDRLLTGYIIVQRGPWLVEARASCPERSGGTGIAKLQAALDAIDWNGIGDSI